MVEQGIWIMRTSHKFQDLYNDLDIAAGIQKKIGMDKTTSKSESWKGRKCLRVKQREGEEWKDLD